MDSIFLFISGILLLIITIYDIFYTTLLTNGAGICTRWITRKVWSLLFIIAGRNAKHTLLSHSGLLIVMSILIIWVVSVWIGNSLIFIAWPDSVISVKTGLPVDIPGKIYFTGYTLSTLGIGNYVPNGPIWEIYTAAISFFGLTLLTLSISYIIPTLSADIQKRNLCVYVSSLGETPEKIILNAWNGNDLKQLTTHFDKISEQVMLYSQHHLAYPILHYYHSKNKIESPAIALTALDEALTIMLLYIPEEKRPSKLSLYVLRRSINSYLQTLHDAFIKSAEENPPIPDLTVLQKHKIILDDIKNQEANYQHLSERRKLLAALVYNDGWKWSDVVVNSDGLKFANTPGNQQAASRI